jgi:hypothetical protein
VEARFPRGFPRLILDGVWLRLVLTAMVLVASASLLTGTAASLNSTTVNPGTSFEAGDLILSNHAHQSTPCLSRGTTVTCDALFPAVVTPGVPVSTTVTLTNLGTLPVGQLVVWSTACTESTGGGAKHGSGALCSHTWLTIHDDGHDFCFFPSNAAGACPADAHQSYSDFAAKYSQPTPLTLNPDHLGGGNDYTLTATLDPALGNDFQDLRANLAFSWEIVQA